MASKKLNKKNPTRKVTKAKSVAKKKTAPKKAVVKRTVKKVNKPKVAKKTNRRFHLKRKARKEKTPVVAVSIRYA